MSLLPNAEGFTKNQVPLKNLEGLSYILRHKELWPEGFVWDYSKCTQCAMGLANSLFHMVPPGQLHSVNGPLIMSKTFDIGFGDSENIFIHLGLDLHKENGYITPEDVATAIDSYIEDNRA